MYIILDLNGVLLKRWDKHPGLRNIHKFQGKWIQLRPGWLEFLNKLLSLFKVGIWSTMAYKNILSIYSFMERQARHKIPLFMIWGKENCYQQKDIIRPDKNNVIADFKPLCFVWKHFCSDLNNHNTILVDDSPYKACMNNPFNCIFPETFDGYNDDNYLNDVLWTYLERLKMTSDVQTYIKQNHIGQRQVHENHSLYGYLRPVIEKFQWESKSSLCQSGVSLHVAVSEDQNKANVQSIYEELDAEQIELLYGIALVYPYWNSKIMSRGEALTFAMHLGLKKEQFSEQDARDYIKSLVFRWKKETGT